MRDMPKFLPQLFNGRVLLWWLALTGNEQMGGLLDLCLGGKWWSHENGS